jgi:hypothetical protein
MAHRLGIRCRIRLVTVSTGRPGMRRVRMGTRLLWNYRGANWITGSTRTAPPVLLVSFPGV